MGREREKEEEDEERKGKEEGQEEGEEGEGGGREKEYRTQNGLKFDSAVLKIYSSFYFIIWI